MGREELRRVLGVVLPRLGTDTLQGLCLVGTAATVLSGVDCAVGDVDFLAKDRVVVDRFATALGDFTCLTPPSLLPGGIQYFCAIDVDGARVEASTVEIEAGEGIWEVSGKGPWEYQSPVTVGDFTVPTVRLELRLATELSRDRVDRYLPIIEHFAHFGETPLLHEVLTGRGLDRKYDEAKRLISRPEQSVLNGP